MDPSVDSRLGRGVVEGSKLVETDIRRAGVGLRDEILQASPLSGADNTASAEEVRGRLNMGFDINDIHYILQ